MNESKFLKKKKSKNKNPFLSFVNKILFCFLIVISVLVLIKVRPEYKDKIYNKVFNSNFSFAKISKWYKDKFGNVVPIDDIVPSKDSVSVFKEDLKYSSDSLYKDGVKLTVEENYLIPVIESGVVVFIGEKEGYGNSVIIQQSNGIDTWYSNVSNTSLKLYDYVEKGSLLGEVNGNYLYLVFQKDGKFLNYKDYI